MLVNKCDVCGKECDGYGSRFRVKGLKIEEDSGSYGFDIFWKRKDLCSDCKRNVVRAAKLLKAGLEVNEVFVHRDVAESGWSLGKIRTVRVHKEQFDAIENKAEVIISCAEDGRCLTFDRVKEVEPSE